MQYYRVLILLGVRLDLPVCSKSTLTLTQPSLFYTLKNVIFLFTHALLSNTRIILPKNNASSKSWIISSVFSQPILKRIVFGRKPWSSNSYSVHCECVVTGWIINDLTSATFVNKENNSRLSIKILSFLCIPLMSNVEPPPLEKYFLYNSCCLESVETLGWDTLSTRVWLFKYSTTFSVL